MISNSTAPSRIGAEMPGTFSARFVEAIRRRTYPNTGLHPKTLAHIAGRSVDTFSRWCRGEGEPAGASLGALAGFFAQQGDWGFVGEVMGLDLVKRAAAVDARLEKLDRELAELRADLKGSSDAANQVRARDAGSVGVAGRVRDGAGQSLGHLPAEADGVAAGVELAGGGSR